MQEFNDYFDVNATSELKNATVLIAATRESGAYEYGASYWNRIVFRFVPAQFVGESFKNSLMVGGTQRDLGDFTEDELGYRMPPGSTVTGIGDAFHEFSYLGCLFFAAMAYLFKDLWAAASQANGTAFAKSLGCSTESVSCMRSLPASPSARASSGSLST